MEERGSPLGARVLETIDRLIAATAWPYPADMTVSVRLRMHRSVPMWAYSGDCSSQTSNRSNPKNSTACSLMQKAFLRSAGRFRRGASDDRALELAVVLSDRLMRSVGYVVLT